MKINSVKKLEKSVVELEIAVTGKAFTKAVDEAYAEAAPNIAIKGFRKGKAPRNIVEKMYGKGMFYEKAINKTYGEAYDKAIEEAGLDVVAPGEIDIKSVDDKGYVLIAKVPVRPEVTLGEYKGIEAEKMEVKVEDAQIEQELEHVRKAHARTVDVTDRAAQMGDTVVLDFDGSVDGVPFDGGKAENHSLVLGSGSFIPGFEDQLVGKNIDEDVVVSVTFPEEYHEKSLAGKAAEFKCVIHEIKFEELPELDDEFAKDVSEFDTLDAYKADMKNKMAEYMDAQADRAVEQAIMEKIVEGMTADVPDAMVEQQIDTMINEYDQNMRQQGLDIQTYLKYTGMKMEDFRASFKDRADKTVRARLALEEIVKAESVVVSEDELEAEYKRVSEQYGVELDQVKAFLPADQMTQDIAVDKALKFVVANAKVTVKKEKKAAAKKTTAKKTTKKAEEKTEE